jgi:hypothetical protein
MVKTDALRPLWAGENPTIFSAVDSQSLDRSIPGFYGIKYGPAHFK